MTQLDNLRTELTAEQDVDDRSQQMEQYEDNLLDNALGLRSAKIAESAQTQEAAADDDGYDTATPQQDDSFLNESPQEQTPESSTGYSVEGDQQDAFALPEQPQDTYADDDYAAPDQPDAEDPDV